MDVPVQYSERLSVQNAVEFRVPKIGSQVNKRIKSSIYGFSVGLHLPNDFILASPEYTDGYK